MSWLLLVLKVFFISLFFHKDNKQEILKFIFEAFYTPNRTNISTSIWSMASQNRSIQNRWLKKTTILFGLYCTHLLSWFWSLGSGNALWHPISTEESDYGGFNGIWNRMARPVVERCWIVTVCSESVAHMGVLTSNLHLCLLSVSLIHCHCTNP